uniref:Uncharacterized protein n=1 Tax=Seriola lalandi dorsalis TaxID=1841481 RepID=A0A3B4XSI1_SERLL
MYDLKVFLPPLFSLYYTSTYGAECSDACEDRGSGYYWCNTQKGWDYCSPSNNVDYKGNICHKDYTCSREGQNYYWCYLEKGGWGYCAQMLPKTMTHYTRYQEECINPCQYQKNGDYYWCYTKDSWSYCSPQADFTYKFKSCRPDHNCGTHGQNYTWCYITDDDWDYCGLSHFDACMQTEFFTVTEEDLLRNQPRSNLTFYNLQVQQNKHIISNQLVPQTPTKGVVNNVDSDITHKYVTNDYYSATHKSPHVNVWQNE